ncbi:MAG TPA: hypothetical protein VH370_08030 [Humisphaera sp.]|jgi:hypothetical protein|nr:hypothetical protein [Humisphaera sp.]
MPAVQPELSGFARPAQSNSRRPTHSVEIKKEWDGDWQPMPYLECIECIDCAAPGRPKATFRWVYGVIKREDQTEIGTFNPRDYLLDQFVRVRVQAQATEEGDFDNTPFTVWVGFIADIGTASIGAGPGSSVDDSETADTGDQLLIAYGLVHLLDKIPISGAYAKGPDFQMDADSDPGYFQIDKSLTFNEHLIVGLSDIGNRSIDKVTRANDVDAESDNPPMAYVFADDGDWPAARPIWSVRDIVDYLLTFHAPDSIQWSVSTPDPDPLDAIKLPRVDLSRLSIFAALNELIDRRRGLGWSLIVHDADEDSETGADTVELQVFTLIDVDVAFEDGLLPANTPTDLDIGGLYHLVRAVRFDRDTITRVGKIRVIGEPIVACFTVSFADGTLEAVWKADEEEDYESVAGPDAHAIDQGRLADKFEHVYLSYRIRPGWNWNAGDGENGTQRNANPGIKLDGTLDLPGEGAQEATDQDPSAPPIRDWGHTLLRSIPLFKDETRLDGEPEFREPIVFIKEKKKDSSGAMQTRWRPIHKVVDPADVAGHVRLLDREFGFKIEMSPNHLMGKGHFDGQSETQPKYDYMDIVATVAARTDTRLAVEVDVAGVTGPAASRVKEIHVGDAEMWYVLPNAVLDVNPANLAPIRATPIPPQPNYFGQGLLARDDSKRLRQIAATAKAWYGRIHSCLSLELADVIQWPIGAMVGKATDGPTSRDVNSPVTEVTWRLDEATTTVRTGFGELDFVWSHRHTRALT